MSSQPSYRRPSWVQHDKIVDSYKRSDSAVSHGSSNSTDYGPENFSYDPAHLAQWEMPDNVLKDKIAFPQVLKIEVHDWALAGAALSTALDRIARLKKEAVERGWPRAKTYAQLSRSAGAGSPAAQSSSSSPQLGSPLILPGSLSDGLQQTPWTPPGSAEHSLPGIIPPRPTPIGMESPAVSPRGSSTPANMPNDAKAVLPDLSKLPNDFTALSRTTSASETFDENAWETYINSYRAELSDVRAHSLARLKGFSRTVDRLVVEYGNMTEFRAGIASFEQWWVTTKPMVVEYENRVKALSIPDLEQVRKQRADLGLPL